MFTVAGMENLIRVVVGQEKIAKAHGGDFDKRNVFSMLLTL